MFKMTLKELDGVLLEHGITDKENFGILTRNSREIAELFFCLKEIMPDKWGIGHIDFIDMYNIYKNKTILFPYDGSMSACGELGAKNARCMFWNDIKYYITSKLRAEKIGSFKDPATLTLTNVYINPLFKKYLESRDTHEREELYKMMTEKDDRAQEQSSENVECETTIDYEDDEECVNEPYNEDDYDSDPTEDSNYEEDYDEEYDESDEETDCAADDNLKEEIAKISGVNKNDDEEVVVKGFKLSPDKIEKMGTDDYKEFLHLLKESQALNPSSDMNEAFGNIIKGEISKIDDLFAKMAAYSASHNSERPDDSKEGEQITKDIEPAQEKIVETTEAPAYMNVLKDTINSYQNKTETEPKKFGREDLQTGDIIVRENGSIEVAIPQYDVLVRQSGYNRISELPKYFNSEDNVTNGPWTVTNVYRPSEAYQFHLTELSRTLTKNQELFSLRASYEKDEWKIIAAGRYECPYCSKENKQKTAFCPHCGKSIMDIKE